MKARPSDPLARVNSLFSRTGVRFTPQYKRDMRSKSLAWEIRTLPILNAKRNRFGDSIVRFFFIEQSVSRAARFICVPFFLREFSLCLRLEVSEKLPQG